MNAYKAAWLFCFTLIIFALASALVIHGNKILPCDMILNGDEEMRRHLR